MSIGFCGCSFTEGIGIDNEQERFSYIVGKELNQPIKNYGVGGSGNYDIFLQALNSIAENDITIVQWSSPGRITLKISPKFKIFSKNLDINVPKVIKKEHEIFCLMYDFYDGYYNQYCQLEKYISILNKLTNKKVYYINGLMYFDLIFLNTNPIINLFELSNTTKKIINFEHETDENIINTIQSIRKKLKVINKNKWILLEESMKSLQLDFGSDDSHPGIKSQKLYADKIIKFLRKN